MPCIHITEFTLLSSFFLITGQVHNAYIPETQKAQTKWDPPVFTFKYRVSKTFCRLDVMWDEPLPGGACFPLLLLEGA